MPEHRITYINKTNRQSAREGILMIGGVYQEGTRCKISLTDAIVEIESSK